MIIIIISQTISDKRNLLMWHQCKLTLSVGVAVLMGVVRPQLLKSSLMMMIAC